MKRMIDVFDYAGDICKAVKKGVLVTAKVDGKVNPMTIGWGTIGIQWGKPIFIIFVRESRYTKQMLDACGEFTINVPYGASAGKILGICGSKSGRDVDKVAEAGITLEEPVVISVPGIKELPLTLECKVIYKQNQVVSDIAPDLQARYYPNDDTLPSDNFADYHCAYYGEIVSAYIIE